MGKSFPILQNPLLKMQGIGKDKFYYHLLENINYY